ncbi:zinc finger protein [Turdus rufiventris]|nr:zinc finger protein [Turdus rufiventris]
MKKPWSPDLPVDNQSYNSDFTSLPDQEGEKELAPDGTEEKKEREKKHTNFTLCNVCNIQLNSAAQAQIHYNGKSHQKRLKQLSNGNLKSDNGLSNAGCSLGTNIHGKVGKNIGVVISHFVSSPNYSHEAG